MGCAVPAGKRKKTHFVAVSDPDIIQCYEQQEFLRVTNTSRKQIPTGSKTHEFRSCQRGIQRYSAAHGGQNAFFPADRSGARIGWPKITAPWNVAFLDVPGHFCMEQIHC